MFGATGIVLLAWGLEVSTEAADVLVWSVAVSTEAADVLGWSVATVAAGSDGTKISVLCCVDSSCICFSFCLCFELFIWLVTALIPMLPTSNCFEHSLQCARSLEPRAGANHSENSFFCIHSNWKKHTRFGILIYKSVIIWEFICAVSTVTNTQQLVIGIQLIAMFNTLGLLDLGTCSRPS